MLVTSFNGLILKIKTDNGGSALSSHDKEGFYILTMGSRLRFSMNNNII